ncbi:hypothetical protein BJ973_003844 [Actinoplanes tereljensis]
MPHVSATGFQRAPDLVDFTPRSLRYLFKI